MNNYLVFQAYGKKEIKNECKFALLVLRAYPWYKNLIPVIYTDEPEAFEQVVTLFNNVKIIKLTNEQIIEWKGPEQFVHRLKIEMLRHFLKHHSGNILYCDTDTYFIKSPEGLFNEIEKGKLFMHTMEGLINKKTHPSFKKWERFLASASGVLDNNRLEFINNIQMWNAGVIGMRSDQLPLLNKILELTDTVYRKFPKHIAEQFAFSYIFQRNAKIEAAEKYIFHYWYLKEFGGYLSYLFQKNQTLNLIDIRTFIKKLPEALLEEKKAYERKTKLIKLVVPKWKIKITGE